MDTILLIILLLLFGATLGVLYLNLRPKPKDETENKEESKASIARKVSKALGVLCNRKLVRKTLEAKRSSKLEKLKNF